MHNTKQNKQVGATLLELLIYIGLLSIVAVFIGGTFVLANEGRVRNEVRDSVNSAIRFSIERINQDIREANGINEPAVFEAGSVLKILKQDSVITYKVDSNNLIRQINSNPVEIITPSNIKITDLVFKRMYSINPQTLKVIASIRTEVTATHTHTYSSFVETKRSTVPLSYIFNYVSSGGGVSDIEPQI